MGIGSGGDGHLKKPIPNIKKKQSPGSVFEHQKTNPQHQEKTNPQDRFLPILGIGFLQSPKTYPQTFKEKIRGVDMTTYILKLFVSVGWVCVALFQAPKHGNGHGSLSNLTQSH